MYSIYLDGLCYDKDISNLKEAAEGVQELIQTIPAGDMPTDITIRDEEDQLVRTYRVEVTVQENFA